MNAIGDVAVAYCSCPVSYSTRRKAHIIVGDDPNCPIHHPKEA